MKEYESILAADPEDAAARRASEDLRARLRPTLHVGGLFSTESGDPRTSEVEVTTVPVSFLWHPTGDLAISLEAEAGTYRNDLGSTRDLAYGVGVEAPLGRHVAVSSEIVRHDIEQTSEEWTGEVALRIAPADRVELRLGGRRSLLIDSRLSATGESIGGTLYGPAVRDDVHLGTSVRIGKAWDLQSGASRGSIGGTNLRDNDRETLFAGFGRTFRIRSARLRVGYSYFRLRNDLDLGGFPPGDLGGDGRTTRGVGGYFSPFDFNNQMVRLDATWSAGDRIHLYAAAAIGRQEVQDVLTTGSEDRSSEAAFSVAWRAGKRVTIELRAEHQDVAAAFERTRIGLDWSCAF
jgi:hypothetical protein